jgi:FMN phosphatase YigB (HAD superfamily)
MALSLDQYVAYLDSRGTPWPAPPEIEPPRAKPHLARLPGIRAVTWNVYGTLVAITGGDLAFELEQPLMMDLALDKTIREFNMWGSMTRRPGQPTDYWRSIYRDVLHRHRSFPGGGERHPEVLTERVWEDLIKKLLQKGYQFDAGSYGALNEFSRKVAYFFHASMQGVTVYPGATAALRHVVDRGLAQGIIGNGQVFTLPQLRRCLAQQEEGGDRSLFDPRFCFLSHEVKARLPSEKLFRKALAAFAEQGINAEEILHIGSRLSQDVVPARRLRMKTGLFAGDKASLEASKEQWERSASRPDVLLTELTQIAEVIG